MLICSAAILSVKEKKQLYVNCIFIHLGPMIGFLLAALTLLRSDTDLRLGKFLYDYLKL